MEVFLDTGEVDERPLASCRMGWKHTKLNPLSPRSGTFPGSQNSKPTGCALSEYDALVGGASTIYGTVTRPVPERASFWRVLHFNSCLAETRELQQGKLHFFLHQM